MRRRLQIAIGWLSQPELDLQHLERILVDRDPGVRMTVVQRWRADFGEEMAVRLAQDRSWLVRRLFYHGRLSGSVPRYQHLDDLLFR